MAILDLAPELLDEIIGYCMPEGFESFALSCKETYTYCKPKIPMHNRLSKRWKYATNEVGRRHDTFRILLEIAREPLVSQYIQHLDLWSYQKDRSVGDGSDPEFLYSEAAAQEIKDMIMDSPVSQYLALAAIDPEDWWSRFFLPRNARGAWTGQFSSRYPEGKPPSLNESYALLALLILLPNLHTLRPHPEWVDLNVWIEDGSEAGYIYSILDVIVKRSHDLSSTGQALSKLKTIYPSYPQSNLHRAAVRNLQWFLQLPSVTSIYFISGTVEGSTRDPNFSFSWRMPEIVSSLTRLELAYCYINPERIALVLSNIPQLQVFKYGQEQKGPGLVMQWSPQLFVEAVARHCGKTITEMAITLHSRGNIEHGVQDFLGFPILKKLEIDLQILCGPSKESGRAREWVGREKFWQVPDGMYKWEEAELPSLASILPASLESVDINFDDFRYNGPAVLALLTDFEEERATRLPVLKKVLLRQWECESERALVEAEGCEFEMYIPDTDSMQSRNSRQKLALWVRQFEEKVGGIAPVFDF